MLSNIQQARPQILFEVAARPRGTWFFYISTPSLFLLLHFQLPFILFHLFPCCILFASVTHPSPFLGSLYCRIIQVFFFFFLPLLILSTEGTLVNLPCPLLLIHNYSASHRRTRCTMLISLLLLPPLLMQKGLIWVCIVLLTIKKAFCLEKYYKRSLCPAARWAPLRYISYLWWVTELRVTGQLFTFAAFQPPFTLVPVKRLEEYAVGVILWAFLF